MSKKKLIVIGNGMVGWKFCEKMIDYDQSGDYEITVFGDEPRPAYDRVQLSSYFTEESAEHLELATKEWYSDNGIDLKLGQKVTSIDRTNKTVTSDSGECVAYDDIVLATGSYPFVPPVPGIDKLGVFIYRTIEDLESILAYGKNARTAAVIGGGLLGLEAAKACKDMGLETHVVEFASRLMPRQLDEAGAGLLKESIEDLGVRVHLNMNTQEIVGDGKVTGMRFLDDEILDVDMIVVSAGIRPRDELGKSTSLGMGERGGITVNDDLKTSDEHIYAIGEVALYNNFIYGLVAPGYDMADIVATNLCGLEKKQFTGADMSTKLKLLGIDVASLGNPFEEDSKSVAIHDEYRGIYKRLVVSKDGKTLIGAILVGDVEEYGQLLTFAKSGKELPVSPEAFILKGDGNLPGMGVDSMEDGDQICSCNDVSKGAICAAIADGCTTIGDLKSCTKAGTGCGGCVPLVTDIFKSEMEKAGIEVNNNICEHFAFSRQELFHLVKVRGYKTFKEVVMSEGSGNGCEVCKPAVASILASIWNAFIVEHDTIQDTNDRYMANIQRNGTYSVIPRVAGGEILPDQLIALGVVANKYDLYTKITGGQRVDLFGANVNDLPAIWEELIAAGFESGHAYGKALRTVKSCVGSTWCRYGMNDSVGLAIRVENRYKGLRSPHKLKSAVSGCVRECAEAQCKDFGIIATDEGWNLYVCGNGGAKPRHGDLLASSIDEDTLVAYIDRFLMFYIRTADKLQRTSVWMENLEGGIDYLKEVIIDDKLGLNAELELDMQHIVDTYQCEWRTLVEDPEQRKKFQHYANDEEKDDNLRLVDQRGQKRPADWKKDEDYEQYEVLPSTDASWVKVSSVDKFPIDGGRTIKYGKHQIAVYNFASRDEWYACQNLCPHKREMVLSRGMIGDDKGEPKVACPLHKRTFSLKSGEGLSDDSLAIKTFPVKIEDGDVWVELPAEVELDKMGICSGTCHSNEEDKQEAELLPV
ncbi:MAG: nitrite reductase small subunit NirD [Lentisphaeria bacterium]|nr:nitrite reductase large subunit NirB [Lentisphaeria bacterium]NQZ67572.1 nitrite reductase small subunit NirD [Lentisphaeria bacterium]